MIEHVTTVQPPAATVIIGDIGDIDDIDDSDNASANGTDDE
jgi:hypothetical protein